MNRILTIIGLVSTVIYTVALYILLSERFSQIHSLPLNEVGDFMAGIFGPLAIFWLILGFLQQGQELSHSTKALELQAQELNNSVKQQKELVEISRQQFEAEIAALAHQRQKEKELALPSFFTGGVGGSHSGTVHKFNTLLTNTGSPITNVHFSINAEMKSLSPSVFPYLDRNAQVRVVWEYEGYIPPEESIFNIDFIDLLGNKGHKQYLLVGKKTGTHPQMEIKEMKLTN